jgi:SAM-dependent methyltransferase
VSRSGDPSTFDRRQPEGPAVTTSPTLLDASRELDRLRLQSRVWEPAGRELLGEIGEGSGLRTLDVGCGALGWLRLLSAWVGPQGEVVGTDVAAPLLDAARSLVDEDALHNVRVVEDDLFASALEPRSFDLVHARFQLAPLGRESEQLAAYVRWLKPGGILVLEEPDSASWHLNPAAPATTELIRLVLDAFRAGGGDFDSGRRLPDLLRSVGIAEPRVRATVRALEPGHPYLRLPLQFASSLEARLVPAFLSAEPLAWLRADVEAELGRAETWGTTFTLISAWGRIPG